ncbi:MAG: hypothetical protein DI551_04280 [Micavibrio aeruginosavorus]|uniref:Uncharacterized protein n=1 Tax=Micavibrio aeruginosavorus TaxID=349221 RepID=A0A2W5PWS4_9BACT|nr:MAG: hypothetical protein DI551_04280 [Micavibrio aeruginosavorus]
MAHHALHAFSGPLHRTKSPPARSRSMMIRNPTRSRMPDNEHETVMKEGRMRSMHSGHMAKVVVLAIAAFIVVAVMFTGFTSVVGTGAGSNASPLPRFADVPVSAPNEGGGQSQNVVQPSQQQPTSPEEQAMDDLHERQRLEQERERLLQEQREAIPSLLPEKPPKPVDLGPAR